MEKEKRISYQEHYVLTNYYQNKIQELEAKLEVSINQQFELVKKSL
tara:strand:- start:27 stop:164 length:138 start_codon:yes stop_codon:yes gene_type:complete